jgi:hypothetical protein
MYVAIQRNLKIMIRFQNNSAVVRVDSTKKQRKIAKVPIRSSGTLANNVCFNCATNVLLNGKTSNF